MGAAGFLGSIARAVVGEAAAGEATLGGLLGRVLGSDGSIKDAGNIVNQFIGEGKVPPISFSIEEYPKELENLGDPVKIDEGLNLWKEQLIQEIYSQFSEGTNKRSIPFSVNSDVSGNKINIYISKSPAVRQSLDISSILLAVLKARKVTIGDIFVAIATSGLFK